MAATLLAGSLPAPVALYDSYQPGVVVDGKYQLQSQLGEGGMGTVWLARNVALDVRVALKLIRPEMRGEETAERLLLEARVEAKLRHPNIVRAFDFGQTELGDDFIVMELLEGSSLAELVEQRGSLAPVEAVQLLLPVIDALCHAHGHGVVHRDIKPQNIFLDSAGPDAEPKLLDFGIAKLMREPEPSRAEDGKLFGSPAYMAPEQARGATDVDARADIWAVCVVLYEAVAGRPAYPGEGEALLRSVIEDEVTPLCDRGAGEEPALWLILQRGLEKDRERRYQSMRELGLALTQWLADQGQLPQLKRNSLTYILASGSNEASSTALFEGSMAGRPGGAHGSRPAVVATTSDAGVPPHAHTAQSWLAVGIALGAGVALVALSATPVKVKPERATSAYVVQAARGVSPQLPPVPTPPPAPARSTPLQTAEPAPVPMLVGRDVPRANSLAINAAPKRRSPRLREAELGLKVPYR